MLPPTKWRAPAVSDLPDFSPYTLPDADTHPAIIAERVLQMPEHSHLVEGEATIDWLMRTDEKRKGGKLVLGSAHMPTVQGDLRDMFEWMLGNLFGRMPDFLIILDREFWRQAPPSVREILVFHELSHCVHAKDRYGAPRFTRDGLPIWGMAAHDVEEFTATVARYGAWNQDIRLFVEAVTSA